jgi:hypothetical protein
MSAELATAGSASSTSSARFALLFSSQAEISLPPVLVILNFDSRLLVNRHLATAHRWDRDIIKFVQVLRNHY